MAARAAIRHRHKWLFGASAFGVVAAGLWLLHGLRQEPPLDAVPAVDPPPARPELSEPAESPDQRPLAHGVTSEPNAPREPPYDGELRPVEVLGNLECAMASGWGAAAGTAVVSLPHGAGAKFSVVDGDGAVFGDTLPFQPNHYRIGRREDGAPLVGLGALRRNSKRFRPPDSPEPVRSREWHQVYRALEHGKARSACQQKDVMRTFPLDIRAFGDTFIDLQKARQQADYAHEGEYSKPEVLAIINATEDAIGKFEQADGQHRCSFVVHVLFKRRQP